MGKDQSHFALSIIASELGYTVRWIQSVGEGVKDVLVLEQECGYFHSFVGANKFDLAIKWLRRKV